MVKVELWMCMSIMALFWHFVYVPPSRLNVEEAITNFEQQLGDLRKTVRDISTRIDFLDPGSVPPDPKDFFIWRNTRLCPNPTGEKHGQPNTCYYQQDPDTGIVSLLPPTMYPDQIFDIGRNYVDGAQIGLYVNRTPEYAIHAQAHLNTNGELRGGKICAESAFVFKDRSTHQYYEIIMDDGCFFIFNTKVFCLPS